MCCFILHAYVHCTQSLAKVLSTRPPIPGTQERKPIYAPLFSSEWHFTMPLSHSPLLFIITLHHRDPPAPPPPLSVPFSPSTGSPIPASALCPIHSHSLDHTPDLTRVCPPPGRRRNGNQPPRFLSQGPRGLRKGQAFPETRTTLRVDLDHAGGNSTLHVLLQYPPPLPYLPTPFPLPPLFPAWTLPAAVHPIVFIHSAPRRTWGRPADRSGG